MSGYKSRYPITGRYKNTDFDELTAVRYDYVKPAESEPNLGLPAADGYALLGNTNGTRYWAFVNTGGSEGPPGPPGPPGAVIDPETGFVIGPPGPTGYAGSRGATGPVGPVGATGTPGLLGDTGPIGPVGYVGSKGAPGTPGIAQVGYTGSAGENATGYSGSSGADGSSGVPSAITSETVVPSTTISEYVFFNIPSYSSSVFVDWKFTSYLNSPYYISLFVDDYEYTGNVLSYSTGPQGDDPYPVSEEQSLMINMNDGTVFKVWSTDTVDTAYASPDEKRSGITRMGTLNSRVTEIKVAIKTLASGVTTVDGSTADIPDINVYYDNPQAETGTIPPPEGGTEIIQSIVSDQVYTTIQYPAYTAQVFSRFTAGQVSDREPVGSLTVSAYIRQNSSSNWQIVGTRTSDLVNFGATPQFININFTVPDNWEYKFVYFANTLDVSNPSGTATIVW